MDKSVRRPEIKCQSLFLHPDLPGLTQKTRKINLYAIFGRAKKEDLKR
jgi:hypothetical protein